MMQIRSEIKSALDSVHASEALKEKTRSAVMRSAAQRPRRRVKRGIAYAICAAAVLCIVFIGANVYFMPTSTISIDINPSIEMDVNRFDRVIDVRSYNEAGAALAETLDVVNDSYEDAIYALLDSETVSGKLDADGVLSIAVIQNDETQGNEILTFINSCTQNRGNVECYCMDAGEASDAHSLGLSYGRYRYYLALREYDPSITPDEVNSMSMRELRDLLYELSGQGGTDLPTQGGCGMQSGGHHHGRDD